MMVAVLDHSGVHAPFPVSYQHQDYGCELMDVVVDWENEC